jgi:ATP-dependent protease ClpP protease subunit
MNLINYSKKRRFSEIYNGPKTDNTNKKTKNMLTENNLLEILTSGGGDDDEKDSEKNRKIERDSNHIFFYSEVNRNSIYELITLINEAEEENYMLAFKLKIEKIPIYLHMCSFGGSIFASASTLISVVCTKRFIRPNSYMLIHQLSSGFWGKFQEIEDEIKNLNEIMDKLKDIYKEHTNIPKKELNELLKHDLWLNSDKCLKYGLVDEIWN